MVKNILTILFIAVMSILLPMQAYGSIGGNLNVELVSITPNPVEPGYDFTFAINVANSDDQLIKDISITLDYDGHFFLKSSGNEFEDNFELCGGCSKSNYYYFTVNSDTISGQYPIEVIASFGQISFEETFFVNVVGIPELLLSSDFSEQVISPKSEVKSIITIENIGTGTAKNIKISPSSLGISLLDSTSLFVNSIKPGKSISLDTTLLFASNIETEPQSINMEIEFNDEISTKYTEETSLGINVQSDTELSLVSVRSSTDSKYVNEEFDLTIRLENIGQGDAQNVKATLVGDSLQGEKLIYVGTIDEGEDVPGIFTISSNQQGENDIIIQVEYEDDRGQHKLIESYSFETGQRGENMPYIITILVVIAVIVVYMKYFRKK